MGDILNIVSKIGNKFNFNGKDLPYFCAWYNKTWRNERCIELPIVTSIINEYNGSLLEVGNVVQNYGTPKNTTRWDIVDQFEKSDNVINIDIFKYKPEGKYHKVIAISTVEHFHEHTNDPARGIKGIKKLMSFVAPGGILVFTIPAGWNKVLDEKLYDLPIDITEMRKTQYGLWEQCEPGALKDVEYDMAGHSANGVYICVFKKSVTK